MEIEKPVVTSRPTRQFLEQVLLSAAFGFFGYVILFFIAGGLILPVLTSEDVVSFVFWPASIVALFVVEVWIADAVLHPLKHEGLKGGFLSASVISFLLIAASPLLFADESVRSSFFSFVLLLVSPFVGTVVGGWFVSRRAA